MFRGVLSPRLEGWALGEQRSRQPKTALADLQLLCEESLRALAVGRGADGQDWRSVGCVYGADNRFLGTAPSEESLKSSLP